MTHQNWAEFLNLSQREQDENDLRSEWEQSITPKTIPFLDACGIKTFSLFS